MSIFRGLHPTITRGLDDDIDHNPCFIPRCFRFGERRNFDAAARCGRVRRTFDWNVCYVGVNSNGLLLDVSDSFCPKKGEEKT